MEYSPEGYDTPYIQILNMSSSFERDDTKECQQLTLDVMVVTSHVGEPGEFGSKQSDDIMDDKMELLISKGVTVADRAKHVTMTDFEDAGCFLLSLNYSHEFDVSKTIIRKILTIQTMITEV
jgi:hypothetical protein